MSTEEQLVLNPTLRVTALHVSKNEKELKNTATVRENGLLTTDIKLRPDLIKSQSTLSVFRYNRKLSKKELTKIQLLQTRQKQIYEDKYKTISKKFSDSESDADNKHQIQGIDLRPDSIQVISRENAHHESSESLQHLNELRKYKLGLSPTRKRRMMLQRTDLIRNVNSRLAWDYYDQEEESKRRISFHEGIHLLDPKTAALNPRNNNLPPMQNTGIKLDDEEEFEKEINEKMIAHNHHNHKAIAIRPLSKYGADLRLSNSLEDYSFPVISAGSSIVPGSSNKGRNVTPMYTPATYRTPHQQQEQQQVFDDEESLSPPKPNEVTAFNNNGNTAANHKKKFSLELRLLHQHQPGEPGGGNESEQQSQMSDSFRDERREQFMTEGMLSVSRDGHGHQVGDSSIVAEDTTILTHQIVDNTKKISSQAMPLPTRRKTPKKYTKYVEELDHRPQSSNPKLLAAASRELKPLPSQHHHHQQQQQQQLQQQSNREDTSWQKHKNNIRARTAPSRQQQQHVELSNNGGNGASKGNTPTDRSSSPSSRLQCSECYCQAVLWCTQCILAYCILCWNRVPHHTLYNMVPAFPNELVKQYQKDKKRIDEQYNFDLEQGMRLSSAHNNNNSPEKNKSYSAKVMFASMRNARTQEQHALKEELIDSPPSQPKLDTLPIDRNLLPAPVPVVDDPRKVYKDYPLPGVFLTGRGHVLDIDDNNSTTGTADIATSQRRPRSMQQQRQQKEQLKELMFLDQQQRHHYHQSSSPSTTQSNIMSRPVSSASISRHGVEGSERLKLGNSINYILPSQVVAIQEATDNTEIEGEKKPPRSAPAAFLQHQHQTQQSERQIVVKQSNRSARSNLRRRGDDRAQSPAFNLGGGGGSGSSVNIAAQGRPPSSARPLTGITRDLIEWKSGSFKKDLVLSARDKSPLIFQDDLTKSGTSSRMERQQLSPKPAEIKIFSGVPVFTKDYKPRSGSSSAKQRKETVATVIIAVTKVL